jgi:hypothetical protein
MRQNVRVLKVKVVELDSREVAAIRPADVRPERSGERARLPESPQILMGTSQADMRR